MRDDFLGPERSSGIVGWAVRQLAMWAVIGVVAYSVATSNGWIHASTPGPAARMQATQQTAKADDSGAAPADRPALGRPAPVVTNSLNLRARSDGHVILDASVNGVPVRFLVDTGATTVALTPADATRAGVAGGLNYSIVIATANGNSRAAPVSLREIRVGTLEVDDIEAEVMEAKGGISLLGQTFLNRLQSYQMRDGVLTLTWQQ